MKSAEVWLSFEGKPVCHVDWYSVRIYDKSFDEQLCAALIDARLAVLIKSIWKLPEKDVKIGVI